MIVRESEDRGKKTKDKIMTTLSNIEPSKCQPLNHIPQRTAANPNATVPMTAVIMPPKLWLTALGAALVEPSKPSDIPPAAWEAPPKKLLPPHLLLTALYRSVCPPMSGELPIPGPYGTLCSKLMYDKRMLRVQDVQRAVESIWGWRKKKRRLDCLKVVTLGIIAGVWAVSRLVLATWFQRYCLTVDTEVPPTVMSTLVSELPPDEEGVVASVTQYLSLTSLVQSAFLSGVNA